MPIPHNWVRRHCSRLGKRVNMVKARESVQRGCWQHFRAAGCVCALILATTIPSGCRSTKDTKVASSDPLMGERPPEQPFGVAGPTPPPQNRAGMGAPSPPTATASKSIAGIVAPDPLIGAKPIAIADSNQPQQTPTTGGGWQAKDPPSANPPGGPGPGAVILRTPEPVPVQRIQPIQPVPPPTFVPGQGAMVQPVPPPPAVPSVGSSPQAGGQTISPVGFIDSDPLQSSLKARGVIWQDQKTLPDGVHFTCRVANQQDPNSVRVYEATGSDYPSAVQAVLNQIDQQR
jgi:hypothetical protein